MDVLTLAPFELKINIIEMIVYNLNPFGTLFILNKKGSKEENEVAGFFIISQ